MQQIYGHYTPEDFEVWQILYDCQVKNLQGAASKAHLEGMDKVNFVRDKIPYFSETNEILINLTKLIKYADETSYMDITNLFHV